MDFGRATVNQRASGPVRLRKISLGPIRLCLVALCVVIAGCGSDPDAAAPTVTTDVSEAPESQPDAPASPETDPASEAQVDPDTPISAVADSAETDLAGPEAENLAHAEVPIRQEPAIEDAICVALVPSDPASDAVGVVTYQLTDDWTSWQYLALWVPGADGESALRSGEPSVRNGDSFEFAIDHSMRAADRWVIDTMAPDGSRLPCAVSTITGTTAAGLAGTGGGGY